MSDYRAVTTVGYPYRMIPNILPHPDLVRVLCRLQLQREVVPRHGEEGCHCDPSNGDLAALTA